MPTSRKVILVSPNDQLYDFLESEFRGWDLQTFTPSVEDMYYNIENNVVDGDNTQIIVFDGSMINDSNLTEVVSAIALYAPYALVFLLLYEPGLKELIEDRAYKQMDDENNVAPFFVVSAETAIDEIEEVEAHNEAFLNGQEEKPRELPENKIVGNPALVTDDDIRETIIKETQGNSFRHNDGTGPLGYVISSTSSKGGSGKSTVALTLATTIAQASQKAYDMKLTEEDPLKVCVVDMDIRDGQIGYYIGQLQPTALNIRVASEITPEVVAKNLVYDDRMMISALLAPKRSSTAGDLSPSFYRQVIETLKTMFDLIILDTSVAYYDPLAKDVCFPLSDALLFISNLSAGSVFGMTRWVNETTEPVSKGGQGLNPRKVGVVLNGVMDDVGMSPELLSKAAAGLQIISMIPMDSKTVLAASNLNRLDKLPESLKLGPQYFKLAEVITKGMAATRPGLEIKLEPLITKEMENDAQERRSATVSASSQPKKKRSLFGRR